MTIRVTALPPFADCLRSCTDKATFSWDSLLILWFIQTFFPTMRCRERVSCRLQRLGNLRSLIWCPGNWGTCLSHHPASLAAHSQALIVAAMYQSMVPWLAPLKPLILRVWEQCCFEKLLYLLWRLITILHPFYNHSPMIFPIIFPHMAIFLVEIPAKARHAILLWLHGFVSRQNRWQNRWICFGQPQGPTGCDSTNRF